METDLECYIKKVSIELRNFPEFDYIHLVSYLSIEYKERVLGEYRLYFTLEGDVDDSDFIMY
ncbi:hypothetical protein FLK61_31500 [Paenalkalicoccus suaedae]|uniref:Uncharacterized protein n=1 Tax=Paenalkalicoccus suaedae TaxID=2592382 RepID=A0A859FEG6_9BACI|nr:hypothetical protein FLK61_31500 [Paenalkalicoccus suaedae]